MTPLSQSTPTTLSDSAGRQLQGLVAMDTQPAPRILVVDDDPIFCKTVKQIAKRNHLEVTTCQTVGDLCAASKRRTYDVAVLDYSFGELTALQVGYLLGMDIPIVLVSTTARTEIHFSDWPFNIREFVGKGRGVSAILHAAMRAAGGPLKNGMTREVFGLSAFWVLVSTAIFLGLVWARTANDVIPGERRVPMQHWDAVPVETYNGLS